MDKIELPTLGDDFRLLVRAKLKNKDEKTLNEALDLYNEGLLGFLTLMTAKDGTIDIEELKTRLQNRKIERERQEREAKDRAEQERKYDASLKWLYETDDREYWLNGGYCAATDLEGIIRLICYESGDHREGGAIYQNTPYGQFGNFNRAMSDIKTYSPQLYAKLAGYKAG